MQIAKSKICFLSCLLTECMLMTKLEENKWAILFFFFLLEQKNVVFTLNIPTPIVLSTSFGKMFFAWHFLNENVFFWLTISYQALLYRPICLFCFYVLFSNMYPKIKLTVKIGLTYAISTVKWFFFIFCLRKHFLLFFAEFELLTFHNNIVKILEKRNKQTLLKSASKLPSLQISA